jgi:predicted HAD superfamily Cof-like phosphohydrolase
MSQIAKDVAEFHEMIASPPWPGPIADMPVATLMVRNKLIREEVQELVEATIFGNLVGIADGLADIVYVAYGTAYTYGIDLDAVLAEAHRSNMSKEPGPTGKAVKGAAYSPPDVAGVLARQEVAQ